MSRMRTVAILTSVIDALLEEGGTSSWDHLQCAVYLLIHAAGVEMDFRFERVGVDDIRSAAMREEVTSLCADGLLERKFSLKFGPVLVPTSAGRTITQSFPKTVGRASERIHAVARAVAGIPRREALNVVLAWQRLSEDGHGPSVDCGNGSGSNGKREPEKASRNSSRATARAKDLIEALAGIRARRRAGPYV